MGASLFLTLCVQLATQPASRPAAVSVEWGIVRQDGSLSATGLGLGDGGMPAPVDPGPAEACIHLVAPGSARTAGGTQVEVREAGCHLLFPSGERLLIDGKGRVHRRDGVATLPAFHGIALLLTDGTTVHVRPGRLGNEQGDVFLGFHGEWVCLWSRGHPAAEIVDPPPLAEVALLAIGGGSTLYRGVNLAPVIVLERVLGGADDAWPAVRVLILGDLIRSTCAGLPEHAPRRSVQFPRAEERAIIAAEITRDVFPPGERGSIRVEARAADWIAVELGPEIRLDVALRGEAGLERLVTTLGAGPRGESLVEWTSGLGASMVFQVREGLLPRSDGFRYVQQGISLAEEAGALGPWCPAPPLPRDRVRALDLLRRIR